MSSSLANLSRDHYRGGVVIVKRHPSGACHFSRGARVSTVKQQQVTREAGSKIEEEKRVPIVPILSNNITKGAFQTWKPPISSLSRAQHNATVITAAK